jgi:hypothetical protein
VRLLLSLAGGWWVFLSSGRNVSTAFLVCKQGGTCAADLPGQPLNCTA